MRSTTMSRDFRRAFLCLTTALASGLASPALAQTSAPEVFRNNDEHGVDLTTGTLNVTLIEGDVGKDGEGLKLIRYWGQSGWRDNWSGALMITGTQATITFGNIAEYFTWTSGTWVNGKANGATLTGGAPGSKSDYQFKSRDGTAITYTNVYGMIGSNPTVVNYDGMICQVGSNGDCAVPTQISDPDGSSYSLRWGAGARCQYGSTGPGGPPYYELPRDNDFPSACDVSVRLEDVRSKSSYALKLKYENDLYQVGYPGWQQRTSAKFYDLSRGYCGVDNQTCDDLTPAATVTYQTNGYVTTVTDERGGSWRFTRNGGWRLTGIRRPNADPNAPDTTTISYNPDGRVNTITANGETKTYNWAVGANTTVSTATSAGETAVVTSTPAAQQPVTVTSGANTTTTYEYDSAGRVTRETRPEGDYTATRYDPRGNVEEVRLVAKPGSGLADIVTTASFDTICTNAATCNKPSYTVDAAGNRTDYTYDANHGGTTRVQSPAAAPGGVRPEVNYAYTALYPQVRDASNALVNAPAPESKVTQITTCATAATCPGSANETKITIAYDNPNLLVTAVTTASGDGAISATTAYTYDAADNLKTIDGPVPGDGDTTTHFYDGVNRRRGTIGPDPDNGGPRNRPAERVVYDPESRVSRREFGSATAATDAALDAMTITQFVDYKYDLNGNLVMQAEGAGSTYFARQDFSYDADNRLLCTAVRMNPDVFAMPPLDGCTSSTYNAAYGYDRITRNSYDTSGRINKVQTAYGISGEQADEVSVTYTDNGKRATLKDAQANLTAYEYDGHDRVWKTRFPVPAQGANASSTTDYEQLTYNAAGQLIQRRLRDNGTISFAWDNLNRLQTITPSVDPAVTFQYDLSGRLITRTRQGVFETLTWDALGRLTSEPYTMGTLGYSYDGAGRMNRITWHDGFYAAYDYDNLGLVTAIRENGAAVGLGVLATYTYDDLGRRTGITRGNGTTTAYQVDAAGRLGSFNHDLAGTAADFASSGMTYNPAGQLASITRSNDAYAFTGTNVLVNVDRDYTANGLNQLTQSGGVALGYDARGNLTTSGSAAYGYNQLNQLVKAPGHTLAYDIAGRLAKISSATGTTRFGYAGSALVSETANGALLRRYVPGPGTDEPVVWYEGSGTTDRRWLHADERGSVIVVSDAGGASLGINRYDEYGIPHPNNLGRFGYTGQVWLGEIGLNYYKARMYSYQLGRFMQTDPIGYADGMNWYNYVGSDPVNSTDPSGLSEICIPAAWYRNKEGVHASDRKICYRMPDPVASTGLTEDGGGISGEVDTGSVEIVVAAPRRVGAFLNTDGNFSCSFLGGNYVRVAFSNNGVIDRVDANLNSIPASANGYAIPQLTNPGSTPFFQTRSSHIFYLSDLDLDFNARTGSLSGLYQHTITGRGSAPPVNDVGTTINVSIYTNGGSGGCSK